MEAQRALPACAIPLVIALAFVTSGDAAASCAGAFNESFWGYSYILSPGRGTPQSIESAFWALGFGDPAVGGGNDNGSWNDTDPPTGGGLGWLDAVAGMGSYLYGTWSSSPSIDGCITGRVAPTKSTEIMVVAFSDDNSDSSDAFFAIAATARDPGSPDFDFSFGHDIDLVQIPRPVIVSSARLPDGRMQLGVRGPSLADVVPGVTTDGSATPGELVTGFRLYYQNGGFPGPSPTRRRDSGWIPLSPVTVLGQTIQVVVDCSCHFDYLAISLVFESGFETAYVSRNGPPIECDRCIWTDFDGDGYTADACCTATPDCDDGDPSVHPGATEVCNGIDDDCNGLVDDDPSGVDADDDRIAAACDVCPTVWDPAQHDRDADGQGDACDLDDGVIELTFAPGMVATWQQESGFEAWNLYRGDLAVLRAQGLYTQEPGSNPLADRSCHLLAHSIVETSVPGPGEVAFFLVTGAIPGGGESGLGFDSTGAARPNAHPCP